MNTKASRFRFSFAAKHLPQAALTLTSSNPNMSRMPMNPSVAWRTAELSTVIDLEDLAPLEPMVDACWLPVSAKIIIKKK